MNPKLEEQIKKTLSVAHEILGNVDLTGSSSELLVSAAQENVLESYADLLETRERQLIEDLRRVVLEYSAKIAATRSLLHMLGREAERRLIWRENIEGSDGP